MRAFIHIFNLEPRAKKRYIVSKLILEFVAEEEVLEELDNTKNVKKVMFYFYN